MNYYLVDNPKCEHCGHQDDPRHVGRSSVGWTFALHVYPDEGINTLEDWKRLFEKYDVADEYGRAIPHILSIIGDRHGPGFAMEPIWYKSWDEFLEKSQAVFGPNGLLRRKIGQGCIGHGEGTWDYVEGDFS